MEKSVAILCRVNAGLRIYEEALANANIKYYLVGRSGYWGSAEVKAALSYISCAVYPSDYALAGALRSPLFPARYLPKTKLAARLKELQQTPDPGFATNSYWHLLTKEPHTLVEPRNTEALHNFTQFVHSLSRYKDLPADEAVKQILGALKAFDHYAEEEATPDNDPVANLNQLVKIAGRFGHLKEFLDYARKVSAASKRKTGVALSSCHAAKGLEFNTVYLIQCSEGILPHAKSTDLESERNV